MEWLDLSQASGPSPLEGLHPLVSQTLLRRGIITSEAARAFLDPQSYSPAPATDIPGLSVAADRVMVAVQKHEPVCVWGDFDVDGQTSTTILVQTLQALGADVTYHIPVRERESHGVNIPFLTEVIERGAKLILTCDTGITAHAAVEYASSRHVDMVITDHHDLAESLPPAAAVTDPKLLPGGHPLSTLSGSGLAYKLAEELYARFGRAGEATQHLDLATLGLVADLAMLTGDTRYLVQRGLDALRNTKRLGLQTMLEMAELVPANLTEEHIGFVIGPRLNALGRLGDANPAVELLTTSDPVRAYVLATQLEGLNVQRQLLCSQVTRAAEAQLSLDPSLLAQPVLVLGHAAWPGGVVGIVASRLVERYRKPAILFSTPPGLPAQGSARSVEGLNITAAIASQKDLLLNFGGHPMAAGLSLEQEKLPEFRRRLSKTVENMLGEVEIKSRLEINGWLDLSEISTTLADALECLAPYGPGNEKLTLATRNLRLQSIAAIGHNREHLKLAVADEAGSSQAVLWWNGVGENQPDGRFDLAYTVRASDWRGTRQVQVEFVDFHLIEPESIQVNTRQIEVIDYRSVRSPHEALAQLRDRPSTLVWAEGEEKKKAEGKDRNELGHVDNLIIWTTPPSPEELRFALDKVQPRTVCLFAATDPIETPEAFLGRLAGLLKFAINHRSGQVSNAGLAAATAQRPLTIRNGLKWLIAQGEINLLTCAGDAMTVSAGTSVKDMASSSIVWTEIQALLAETAAYRAYFKRADKNVLLP